jgi:hypothetical protein
MAVTVARGTIGREGREEEEVWEEGERREVGMASKREEGR